MTQEDKELLLKDLCARLPYGVICKTEKGNGHLCSINQTFFGIEYGVNISSLKRDYFDDINTDEQVIKPYLLSMSSMTKEELKEFRACHCVYDLHPDFQPMMCNIANEHSMFDWLNKHYFDYRGLIEKGLAINATGLNVY